MTPTIRFRLCRKQLISNSTHVRWIAHGVSSASNPVQLGSAVRICSTKLSPVATSASSRNTLAPKVSILVPIWRATHVSSEECEMKILTAISRTVPESGVLCSRELRLS